jgi:hypothetical protein
VAKKSGFARIFHALINIMPASIGYYYLNFRIYLPILVNLAPLIYILVHDENEVEVVAKQMIGIDINTNSTYQVRSYLTLILNICKPKVFFTFQIFIHNQVCGFSKFC